MIYNGSTIYNEGAGGGGGGDSGKVDVIKVSWDTDHFTYPTYSEIDAIVHTKKKGLCLLVQNPGGSKDCWWVSGKSASSSNNYYKFLGECGEELYIYQDGTNELEYPVTRTNAIAPDYDPTHTYPTVGTAVMYGGKRYVSNTAIATAEDWTPAHWTEQDVETALAGAGVTPEDVEQLIEQNGKGVFYADYNITPRADVMAAIEDGKSIICRRTNNDNSTDYAVLDFKGSSSDLEFFGVHDSNVLKFSLSSAGVWSFEETPIGGGNSLYVDNNTYWDDAKEAFDNGKLVYYYSGAVMPNGALRDHIRLFILSKVYQNVFYFVSKLVNIGTSSGNDFAINYDYCVRGHGLEKGGLIISRLTAGAYCIIPKMPNRNSGVFWCMAIRESENPSWIRIYGSYIMSSNGQCTDKFIIGKSGTGEDVLYLRKSFFSDPPEDSVVRFFGMFKTGPNVNQYKIGWYNGNLVPSTTNHHNQNLRSGLNGTCQWEPDLNAGANKTESDISNGVYSVSDQHSVNVLTLTTVSALTVKYTGAGAPNFALEIDNTGNSSDVTVTVKDASDNTLFYSTAAGNSITAGKYVQLTCVNKCWTMAEFT